MQNIMQVSGQSMFYPIILKPTPAVRNIQRDAHARKEATRVPPKEAKIEDVERTTIEVSANQNKEESSDKLKDMKAGE